MMPADVTTRDVGSGDEETVRCADDDYVLVTGPLLRVHHVQRYGNGTTVVTIKRAEEEPTP